MAGIAEQLKKKNKATASSLIQPSLEPFGFGMKSYGKDDVLC